MDNTTVFGVGKLVFYPMDLPDKDIILDGAYPMNGTCPPKNSFVIEKNLDMSFLYARIKTIYGGTGPDDFMVPLWNDQLDIDDETIKIKDGEAPFFRAKGLNSGDFAKKQEMLL